ncbi:MAG: WG repeat-containing protein [Gilvibacter sp.]
MKSAFLMFVMTVLSSTLMSAQQMASFDQISPFHDGLAAVLKDGKWGFIDADRKMVIDYRDDLVADQNCSMDCCTAQKDAKYPKFHFNRALIKKTIDGITHYGYIDKSGKTVIQTDFLYAQPFTKNGAIVVRLYKDGSRENEAIGKRLISYYYNQEVIDVNGKVSLHLDGPHHMTYSKEHIKQLSKLTAKFLNDNLVAVKVNNQWELRSLNNE